LTKGEFIQKANQIGFDSRVFSLDGEFPSAGGWAVQNLMGGWKVYCVERGEIIDNTVKWFSSESDALEYLYDFYKKLRLKIDSQKLNF